MSDLGKTLRDYEPAGNFSPSRLNGSRESSGDYFRNPVDTFFPRSTIQEMLEPPMAAASLPTGAFAGRYISGGDTYLVGGLVQGTLGTKSLGPFKILDGGERPVGIADGSVLWIEVSVDGISDDATEILVGGIEITDADYDFGLTVPDNEFPTPSSGGTLVLGLGSWDGDTFSTFGPGNFLVGGCGGNWVVTRN